MRRNISAVIALLGLVLFIAGVVMNHTSDGGANIGAGFAIIMGIAFMMAGLFAGALKALVPRSHRR